MTIKAQYLIFVLLIHALLAFLAFRLLWEQKVYFYLLEIGLLLSLYLAYRLYRAFVQPLAFISQGVAAIRERDFSVKFLPTGRREMDQLIEVYNQMIDNIRQERVQAREQHYFLQKLLTETPIGILTLDYDERLTDINPAGRQLLSLDDQALGQPLSALTHPLLRTVGDWPRGQSKVVALDGGRRYRVEVAEFVDRGFPRKFLLIQELSQEILEAEKRAYGKVIRMMAHEVNNSIGAINSLLDTLLSGLGAAGSPTPDGWADDARTSLPLMLERNERLNHFMRRFAEVVRIPQPQPERCDLRRLLRDMHGLLLSRAQAAGVTLELDESSQPCWVFVDPQQIEQVVVNAVKNAWESTGPGGRIQLLASAHPAGFIIADNGPGLDDEAAERLFTPFYSNKTAGQGIGLTLSREILLNHGATFSLRTEPDGWTRLRVVLPS